MEVIWLAHAEHRRSQYPGLAAGVRGSSADQRQADLHRCEHGQRQRRFVHGEQSQVPRRCSNTRRTRESAAGDWLMPVRTKYELKIGGATREAFGKALVELGRENPNIVVLDADLSKSTMTAAFGKEFPDRFFECGIAEANMVSIAGGLATAGKIPFASSFSCFLLNKGFEQLRVSVAYPNTNAKFVGTHSGISIGEDGPSQMSIEDLSLAGSLPGFTVIAPADEVATKALVKEAAAHVGPVFIRTGRVKVALVYSPDQKFEIGKGIELQEGTDVTL